MGSNVPVRNESTMNMNIYCAVIRSVVEYASPVFSNLPTILCCTLERMQKRALSVILPGVSYQEALCQSGLAPLEARIVRQIHEKC